MNAITELTKGIYKENPIFRLALGLCPVLAVSTSINNALGMGAAAIFVLLCSNIIVSLVRKGVPPKIRIPIFIVIIATFVTLVEMVMEAYQPALFKSLGIFVPLIVVNCVILGRAEAFASRNGVGYAILDAIGMGIGFTIGLTVIAAFRELLGDGKLLGFPIMGSSFEPVIIMILAPGAFITMGLLLALSNYLDMRNSNK
ncbi:MAG: electron transport complex subunit E [FCB group bacterium]|nr:electron transport complex subunit E [FCB group bacterium]